MPACDIVSEVKQQANPVTEAQSGQTYPISEHRHFGSLSESLPNLVFVELIYRSSEN